MKKKLFSVSFLALAVALALSPAVAHADQFLLNTTGTATSNDPSFASSILIDATPLGGNLYTVTGASGTVMNPFDNHVYNITGVLNNPNGPLGTYNNGQFIYDNLLSTAAPPFNNNGAVFTTSLSGYDVNFYSIGNQLEFADSNWATNGNKVTDLNYTMTPVPEPSALMLFGTGLFGIVGLAKRKFASAMA